MEPEPNTYLLGRRFSYPTANGPKDAVAVTQNVGNILNSVYTLMLTTIIGEVWTVVVLIMIYLSIRKKETASNNSTVVNVAIWNTKGPPLNTAKTAAQYLWYLRRHKGRWPLLPWLLASLFATAAMFAISIRVPADIVIGNGAPVAPQAIYLPNVPVNNSLDGILAFSSLSTPAMLRAAAAAESAYENGYAEVSVTQPTILANLGDGELIQRISYQYTVTALEFGMQHFHGLVLNVEGACTSDYTWLIFEASSTGVYIDTYLPWSNFDSILVNASAFDGVRPLGNFLVGNITNDGSNNGGSNISYGGIISSVQRFSETPSADPFYLTQLTQLNSTDYVYNLYSTDSLYQVKPGRPVLSCWENNVWTFGGHNSSVGNLNSLLGLNMPTGMVEFLESLFGTPMIVNVASVLSNSNLRSTAGKQLGFLFDAKSASIYEDLLYLILGARFATINALNNTVLKSSHSDSFPNLVVDANGNVLPGVADFVLYGRNIVTLSVPALIVIPVMLVVSYGGLYLLMKLPLPWYHVQALEAPTLFSALDEQAATLSDTRGEGQWVWRKGYTYYDKDGEPACVRPEYHREKKRLNWIRTAETGCRDEVEVAGTHGGEKSTLMKASDLEPSTRED